MMPATPRTHRKSPRGTQSVSENAAKAYRLYRDGATQTQIASTMGCSRAMVDRWIRQAHDAERDARLTGAG